MHAAPHFFWFGWIVLATSSGFLAPTHFPLLDPVAPVHGGMCKIRSGYLGVFLPKLSLCPTAIGFSVSHGLSARLHLIKAGQHFYDQ